MDTPELHKALDARIDEIAEMPDVIERTTATTDLLTVLDNGRERLAHAYAGDLPYLREAEQTGDAPAG